MIKITYYIDKAGEHRWRITHINGNIIGASTEGYKNLADAEHNLSTLTNILYSARIQEL